MCQEVKAKQYMQLLGRCTKNRPSTTKVLMTKYSTRMMTVMADITKPVGRFREENTLLKHPLYMHKTSLLQMHQWIGGCPV